jgi:sugar (pentulose or hexulose) kinase
MRHIAVIDIGKTNAKLALVDGQTLREVHVVTTPNTVLHTPPYPHYDLDRLWQFFAHHLAQFQAQFGIDAISVTTHGAAAVLLDAQGNLAAPCLDYEHAAIEDTAPGYTALRPDFEVTGSARLAAGLNLGAQIYWQMQTVAGLAARTSHVLTYPQYWGWRLTGQMACDVCSLGCHTDLWNPWAGDFSPLVEKLGLAGKFAPPRRPNEVLGTLRPDLARQLGLRADTPVSVGIHDSNASLYPYLMGDAGPFSVVSSGTWVVCMAIGAAARALDPARDVLVNVNGQGGATPSARFMGGREYDLMTPPKAQGRNAAQLPQAADIDAVLAGDIQLLPAVVPSCGPFAGRASQWSAEPSTPSQREIALSWYLALMSQTCLDLIGARGAIIVEGPLAHNSHYLDMMAATAKGDVRLAASATGTAIGAACLMLDHGAAPATQIWPHPQNAQSMADYARNWHRRIG